ncbi:PKD domain-containing protein [Marivirga arenosa]|uniref:PKD domain-containing protein n=1 Tax=Marivirga arenosa TaxID=3059076 RepID=A0AA51RB54_9BACT|nr:PKD domain-containing protein [Marivirga sp. ABR2-2]WMN07583.1 PKD domain-containing protein [Marivirga sp. ABR2-2]
MKNLNQIKKWGLLFAAFLIVLSCNDEDPIVGEPPIADAGTDITASVGSNVTLNGSSSSDPEGGTLTFNWELTQAPTGSSATVSNATSEIAIFVPDVEGDYVATLTVEDADGNTATDDVLISATVNDNEAPTAVITDTENQSILSENGNDVLNVGNTFQFSAENSTDPENDALSYSWEVTAAPNNSTPTLANETTSVLDFTADLEGEYTIMLTVNDGNGNESTAEVSITAEVSPVIIDADVIEDTTWEDVYEDPSLPDYRIIGNISVSAYLTIDPGVNVILDENVQVFVGSGGVLDANGISGNMVQFSSSNVEAGQHWKGLFIQSSDQRNSLEYTIVEYAGNSEMSFASGTDYKTNIGLDAGGYLNVQNSQITNSDGYGLLIHDDESDLGTFSTNSFSNNVRAVGIRALHVSKIDEATSFSENASADVEIFQSTLPNTETVNWNKLNGDSKYRVSGELNIDGNLTINAGAYLTFDQNVAMNINSGASINASGGTSNKIVFTSSNIDGGLFWRGILIKSSNQNNVLSNAEVSYAGNSEWAFASGTDYKANIGLDAGGQLNLQNTTVSNGDGYGLFIHDDESDLVSFETNNFSGNQTAIGLNALHVSKIDGATTFSNNSLGQVEIFGSTLATTETVTWNKLDGTSKYTITGNVTIDGNLTVAAGAYFEARENIYIQIEGSIIAEGTDTNKITFTSTSGVKWNGIRIASSNANNSLDYVVVSNGGFSEMPFPSSSDYKCNVGVFRSAVINITNSEFSGSNGYGIAIDQDGGTSVNDVESAAANNTFTNNTAGSVLLD